MNEWLSVFFNTNAKYSLALPIVQFARTAQLQITQQMWGNTSFLFFKTALLLLFLFFLLPQSFLFYHLPPIPIHQHVLLPSKLIQMRFFNILVWTHSLHISLVSLPVAVSITPRALPGAPACLPQKVSLTNGGQTVKTGHTATEQKKIIPIFGLCLDFYSGIEVKERGWLERDHLWNQDTLKDLQRVRERM